MSERFAASSPSSVGPLFAGSHSPDACVPFLPVPVPGVFVLVTSADGPAPPASEPPPLPTTRYMTRNIRRIHNCIKWNFKLSGMWQCCRTTNAHWLEGTTVLSNTRNYFPDDAVPHATGDVNLQQYLVPYAVPKLICWPRYNDTTFVNTGNPCLIQQQADTFQYKAGYSTTLYHLLTLFSIKWHRYMKDDCKINLYLMVKMLQ